MFEFPAFLPPTANEQPFRPSGTCVTELSSYFCSTLYICRFPAVSKIKAGWSRGRVQECPRSRRVRILAARVSYPLRRQSPDGSDYDSGWGRGRAPWPVAEAAGAAYTFPMGQRWKRRAQRLKRRVCICPRRYENSYIFLKSIYMWWDGDPIKDTMTRDILPNTALGTEKLCH